MFTNRPNNFLTIRGISYLWLLCLFFFVGTSYGQIGPVIWEDNFNSLNNNIWVPDIGDGCDKGLCGWGNQELQSYQSENVYIADVPGEAGNKALVLEARNQTAGSRAFTSGKVTTEGNLAIHYGLIEVRIRVPDLEQGLWPAAWLLGTSNLAWPAKGEIDMMEMGFSQEGRNQQQEPNSTVNNYVGANAFFPVPGGGVGNIAYDVDYNQPYVASTPLNDRFVTYRIYWEPSQIRFTVVDGGNEYDLYTNPFPIDPEGVTAAFSRPFYMLLNLAVGGTLPGVLNNAGVTAPLPGKMYVDYVRVSEWNGYGSVEFDYNDLTPESGDFGVYTDETPTNNELVFGSDAEIYVWGETMQEGNTPPVEGDNVIAWNTVNPNSWFGGGIVAINGKDMSNYLENGSLKFKIKIPGNVSFRIGITDNFTNEKYIEFPAGQTKYGLVRNGEWGQVEIPLADYEGLLAFQNIGYMFAITSVDGALPTSTFQFAIDDIVWTDGNTNNPPLVTNISVTPANSTISVGGSQQFQASAVDQFGNPINTNFTWSSSGGSISSSGLFTSNSAGNFTVTATSGSVSDNASITVNAVTSGTELPGTIQAEDYNEGGSGVGYYDTSAGNTGGAYRTDDVDIEATSDNSGDYNVGWIEAGEWLEYTINATAASNTYDFSFRVASPTGNGSFYLTVDGEQVTDNLQATNTGDWQNFTDITANNISISQGQHALRLVFVSSGLNINYLSATASQGNNNNGCSQLAANGDFSAVISSDNNNPSLTFVPERSGVGNPTTILYYSTNPNATFPGYGVTANSAFTINASEGQTVYYYYTYSIPEGGENNTAGNIQSFVVGACGNSSARTAVLANSQFTNSLVKAYPNPTKTYINLDITEAEQFDEVRIISLQGKLLKRVSTEGQSSIRIETADLPNGIYLVEVSGKLASQRIKIVK
ncbi:hypothetical protein GCM10011506_46660 [Marivirga lumbricoides]|uniref:Uncharacterized protein n=1 Tax=Marivirga lumbricoides TaxID=1046115 RepID=A0ABQ1N6H4_9BACT|nr:hypothetical protein GCM10011506_46660 [Marivirga lumbricoides]